MHEVDSMRRMQREGMSISEIARQTGRSWPTVKKWLEEPDLSPKPPRRERRDSKLDPYKAKIESILMEDRKVWHKQRHTAKRIWERISAEDGAEVSYSTVRRYVRERKKELALESVGYMDLTWAPGEMQVDFGEADAYVRGTRKRMHYLVAVFPHSNVGLTQIFPAENGECLMEGLRRTFEWLGGVPTRIVFDNASGITKRLKDGVKKTELFAAFCAHYELDVSFCNPASGWEKGCVEKKVDTIRKNLFTPMPSLWTLDAYNASLWGKCIELSDKDHYLKGIGQLELFEQDKAALRGLPDTAFEVVRWEVHKADKWGKLTLEGRHRYSSGPSFAGLALDVGIGATTVSVLSPAGEVICVHERAYGPAPTDTSDPASQLALLCNKPASWKNSRVREALPEEVARFLDEAAEPDRREALRALRNVSGTEGWQAASAASLLALEGAGRIDEATLACACAWSTGEGPITYEEPVDLAAYDAACGLAVV